MSSEGGAAAPRPEPPVAPEAWECCQSGCDPCVYDRYWDAVARYEQALAEWERQRKDAKGDVSL